jgi:hypothetical protein
MMGYTHLVLGEALVAHGHDVALTEGVVAAGARARLLHHAETPRPQLRRALVARPRGGAELALHLRIHLVLGVLHPDATVAVSHATVTPSSPSLRRVCW